MKIKIDNYEVEQADKHFTIYKDGRTVYRSFHPKRMTVDDLILQLHFYLLLCRSEGDE